MSVQDFRGSAWAIRRWMLAAQQDIDTGGEIKPADRIWRRFQPDQTRRLRKDYGLVIQLRKVS